MNRNRVRKLLPYALTVLAFVIFIQFGLCLVIVNGDSMNDTLHNGDIIAIWQWNVHPKLGDIVVTNQNNPFGISLTKRVVAVSGQHIHLKNGTLYVDEEPFLYAVRGEAFEITVPEGTVFLMGDNYDYSHDSREIGPVPIEDIMGKMVFRVWPILLSLLPLTSPLIFYFSSF